MKNAPLLKLPKSFSAGRYDWNGVEIINHTSSWFCVAWLQPLLLWCAWFWGPKKYCCVSVVETNSFLLNFLFDSAEWNPIRYVYRISLKFLKPKQLTNKRLKSISPFWLRLKIKQVVFYTHKVQFTVEPSFIAWFQIIL